MLVARFSGHIAKDLKRNWSSINYGACGITAREVDFNKMIEDLRSGKSSCLHISGLELFADDLRETQFGELFENYWVIKDTRNTFRDHEGGFGLRCHALEAETLEEALLEVANNEDELNGTGDGVIFNGKEAKLLYSEFEEGNFGLHILEVERVYGD